MTDGLKALAVGFGLLVAAPLLFALGMVALSLIVS